MLHKIDQLFCLNKMKINIFSLSEDTCMKHKYTVIEIDE